MILTEQEKILLRERLNLSKRQAQVVELLLEGLPDAEGIARRMGVGRASVKLFLHYIYKKTGVSSRHEIVLVALESLGYFREKQHAKGPEKKTSNS